MQNQVAFITGSAKRLGAKIARHLHDAGFDVIIHFRKSNIAAKNLQQQLEAKRKNSVYLLAADLLQTTDFSKLILEATKVWGRLDLLINNASTFYPTPIGKISLADWDELIGINLKAPLFLAQAASKHLKKTSGAIINITDIHGERPLKTHSVYSIAKAGLTMLTKSLARELGPKVRVNAIAPGAILWPETNMLEQTKQDIITATTLKRAGTPDDIAKAVLYLAQNANYTTGQILVIDGGRTLSN